MKKLLILIITGMGMTGIATACNLPFLAANPPATQTPTATVEATQTAIRSVTPLIKTPTLSPTPTYAPICESGGPTLTPNPECERPIAEQSSTFCQKKVPVNLLLINAGASFEVLSEGFSCSEAGMKDGKQMVTCTGPIGLSYEVEVCDPACAPPPDSFPFSQCPQDTFFDAQRGCCSEEPPAREANCTLLKLKTRSCVIDCAQYKKESTCKNNSYACSWNATTKKCFLRK